MKTQAAVWKWIDLLLIITAVAGYQYLQTARAAEAEIAGLQTQVAELSAWKADAEKYLASANAGQEETASASSGLPDGVFQGTGTGVGGDIVAEVTVEGGKITDIRVVTAEFEDREYLEMAEKMIPEMIEAQSADVDTVTGATMSSGGLKAAVAAALKAEGE